MSECAPAPNGRLDAWCQMARALPQAHVSTRNIVECELEGRKGWGISTLHILLTEHACPNATPLRPQSYFVKSTLGACAAPGVCSSKYSRGPLPSALAVSTCGKRRMYAL